MWNEEDIFCKTQILFESERYGFKEKNLMAYFFFSFFALQLSAMAQAQQKRVLRTLHASLHIHTQ